MRKMGITIVKYPTTQTANQMIKLANRKESSRNGDVGSPCLTLIRYSNTHTHGSPSRKYNTQEFCKDVYLLLKGSFYEKVTRFDRSTAKIPSTSLQLKQKFL